MQFRRKKNTTKLRIHSSVKVHSSFARGARVRSCYSPITIATRDRTMIGNFDRFCSLPEFIGLGTDRSKLEDRVLGTSSKV